MDTTNSKPAHRRTHQPLQLTIELARHSQGSNQAQHASQLLGSAGGHAQLVPPRVRLVEAILRTVTASRSGSAGCDRDGSRGFWAEHLRRGCASNASCVAVSRGLARRARSATSRRGRRDRDAGDHTQRRHTLVGLSMAQRQGISRQTVSSGVPSGSNPGDKTRPISTYTSSSTTSPTHKTPAVREWLLRHSRFHFNLINLRGH
jgi:hypothetical protein